MASALGWTALTPPAAPLSRLGGRGDGGEGGPHEPTAYAVGYMLTPAPRVDIFNELLRHNPSSPVVVPLSLSAKRWRALFDTALVQLRGHG